MSTKSPSNRDPKPAAPGAPRPASRPTGTGGSRPAGSGTRPAGTPSARPSGRPAPGTPSARPAGRPVPAGQARSARPQGRPVPGAAPNRTTPYLIGGAALLIIIILAGAIYLSLNGNSGGGANGGAATAACGGTADPNGSTACVETTKGVFKIHLYTDDASVKNTVKNFRDKVNSGFYNGKTFHRVEDWVIQGGDPLGNGTGGGTMPAEYNARSFVRGAVGVARGNDKTINNDSQWFVVKTDATYLDNNYTNFGQVTAGMDVVDKIVVGDTMTKITMLP